MATRILTKLELTLVLTLSALGAAVILLGKAMFTPNLKPWSPLLSDYSESCNLTAINIPQPLTVTPIGVAILISTVILAAIFILRRDI